MQHPILFLHGAGDSARVWRAQLEALAQQQAFAIDLPGHGARPDTLPEEASVLDYARAVREIARGELGLELPIIAGHSLGGAIALTLALEYGTELGGLILIATGARLRVLPELLEAARNAPGRARQQLTELSLSSTADSAARTTLGEEQAQSGPGSVYRDLAACNAFDCMARLGEIHLPTLIIAGSEDRMTPLKYSRYLHEHIAGSQLCIIEGAGHYVMRERPQEVNQAIQKWLSVPPLDA